MDRTRTALVMLTVLGALFVVAACGGGGSASKDNEGAAASATAEFFVQEATGGRIPEGQNVASIGAKRVEPLSVNSDQKKQSVKLRYCVEYTYRENVTPFTSHVRVYITQLMKDGWSVESVKPDGTCEGVS
jgi:hypothetical protein